MRKNKILLLLLVSSLSIGTGKAYSEEFIPDKALNSQIAQNLDIDKFKQDWSRIGSEPEVLKGRVKTLSTNYLIVPGDTLSFSVFGEPDLTQTGLLVRPDGNVSIDPIGEVSAAGMSVDQFTEHLTSKLKTYMTDPKISVKITGNDMAKVYIYGAVYKPGLYQQARIVNNDNVNNAQAVITPQLTVASIIANSGGIKSNADLRHIKITNNALNKAEMVDLMKLIKEGDASQDVYLRSGDSIYIPYLESDAQISDEDFKLIASSSIAPPEFPVRVIGAVNRPGVVNISPGNPGLNSALSSAEGYSPDANRKVVAIQRTTPRGNISTMYVNPMKDDVILRPNDLVIVPDKSIAIATRGFNFLGSVIQPFGMFSNTYNTAAEMWNPTRRWYRGD